LAKVAPEYCDVVNRVSGFITEVREAKTALEQFILWPKRWKVYTRDHAELRFSWQRFSFTDAADEDVPDEPGVYTFLIEPGIAGHPCCSFLMYVGKAEKQTLQARFKQYRGRERGPGGRPHIVYLLNEYRDYLVFCCSPLPEGVSADDAEQALQAAYIPPYCRQLPAEVSRVRRAFT